MADRSVVARLGANVTGYVNNIRTAERATVDFSRNAISYGQRHQAQLDQLANKAAILGTGMLALAGFAVKSAMDWETAWAGVTKTIDGTPAQLAAIEQGLQDMSAVKPTSAIELAAIAESAGALGVKTEDILSFTSVMADLGQTTNLSSDEAATSIAQLMNVMQTAPEDVDNLGAALVDLGNKGASTERQIIQMAQNIAGAGAIVGLSEANVLSLGNALASSGIEAEAGGSAISNVLIDIDKAVSTNSEKLSKWADVADMTASDFATSWKADPADAIADIVEGLGRMNDAGGDVFSTLDSLGQSDIRVTRALLNMASSGDMLRESLANGDTAWQQNTALAEEAAKRYDTTASQTKVAWNEIKASAVEAGDALLPVVAGIADAVGGLAGAFGALPAPAQTALTSIVGIGGVGLIAAAGIMKMVTTIGAAKLALSELAVTGGMAASVVGVLAKGGAGLAAFWAGAAMGDQVGDRGTKQIDELASSLEKLGKTGKATGDLKDLFGSDLSGKAVRFGKDLGSIGEALKSLDGYADDNSLTEVLKFMGSGGQSAGITAQAEALMDVDKAFTTLSKNKPDDAIAAFEKLRDRALETGASTKDIERAFPEMTSMLQAASESMGGTSDASEILNGNMKDLAPAAQESAEALQAAQEALDKTKDATRQSAMGFLDFGKGLEDAKTSLQGWIDGLQKMADAQENWADNVIKAMARGVDDGVIAKFQEMGPAGAKMLDELANGSQKSIDRLNAIYGQAGSAAEKLAMIKDELGGEVVTSFVVDGDNVAASKIEAIAAKYKLMPDEVRTIMEALDYSSEDIRKVLAGLDMVDGKVVTAKIKAETDAARTAITSLKSALDSINPFKTVTINTVKTGSSPGGTGATRNFAGGIAGYANGGQPGFSGRVPGTPPADPTADNVMAVTERGKPLRVRSREWIINEEASDEHHQLLAAINAGIDITRYAPGFAAGGKPSEAQARYDKFKELERSSKLELARQEKQIRDVQSSLNATETVGKGKDKHKRQVLRGRDRDLAELELAGAKAELAQMKADNKALKGYGTSAQEERRYADAVAAGEAEDTRNADEKKAAEEAAKASEDAAIEKARAIGSATDDIRGNVNIGNLTSPAAIDRYVARMITDITGFTDVLARLKAKGAAPWLLQQMVKLGPSKSVIRLGEKYLADDAALSSLNSKVAILDEVSGSYGRMVSDERFMQPGAYDTSNVSREVSIAVSTLDRSVIAAEVARYVKHEITTLAQAGGI